MVCPSMEAVLNPSTGNTLLLLFCITLLLCWCSTERRFPGAYKVKFKKEELQREGNGDNAKVNGKNVKSIFRTIPGCQRNLGKDAA